jgi:ATP-dependent protease HslVU (ClpYQ) peptidase subunit
LTTIIAKETAGDVHIGFDSLCTGYDQFELEQNKVFVNNGVIYGVAGRLLLSTELKHAHLPPAPADPSETDTWMTSTLSPRIRHLLNEIAPRRSNDGFSMQVLVVANSRVYEISGDTGWHRRVDGLYAVGSGSPYAFGALASGASLRSALTIAANTDPYTGGRLTVTTAKKLLDS